MPRLFMLESVRGLIYRSKPYFDWMIEEFKKMDYIVDSRIMNAAAYGVPQKRERLVIVGHKGGFAFPTPEVHMVTAGEALGELAFQAPAGAKFLTSNMDAYIARYEAASGLRTPRDLHLDRPARTLTIRNLVGATGDMQRIRLSDGRRRSLSVREAARLQSFPDWYVYRGSESSQLSQIANAVPPLLAYHLAKSAIDYLNGDEPSELPG
jgi:DNA (cytosine-5)-methyltransferase 1